MKELRKEIYTHQVTGEKRSRDEEKRKDNGQKEIGTQEKCDR
jgi:hypothetical protein